ncbi:hypothetical protein Tco_0027926 [Tanacetum coccineum]
MLLMVNKLVEAMLQCKGFQEQVLLQGIHKMFNATTAMRRVIMTQLQSINNDSDVGPYDSDIANEVIQLYFWVVDSGCSKDMTRNLKLLRKFIEKFMGIVYFGNDHFDTITAYGDYVHENITI